MRVTAVARGMGFNPRARRGARVALNVTGGEQQFQVSILARAEARALRTQLSASRARV